MIERSKRVIADLLLVVGLTASFLTHESGVLLHSLTTGGPIAAHRGVRRPR
jgi:hypothetical protein